MPIKKKEASSVDFEVKDRKYIQKGAKSSSMILNTVHSQRNPLQFKQAGKPPRSIRYCTNQDSLFLDEQEGEAILGRVVFVNGVLQVPKDEPLLQQLLSIYHPMRDVSYYEFDPVDTASKQISKIKLESKAINYVLDSKPNEIKAVALSVFGGGIKTKMIEEMRSDLLVQAKDHPTDIIDLFEDEDIDLLLLAFEAIDNGKVKISSSGKEIINGNNIIARVGYNESPQESLKEFLKTEEGSTFLGFLKGNDKKKKS